MGIISDLNCEQIVGTFDDKEQQKQTKNRLELKGLSREKVTEYIINGKIMTILLTVGLIKNILIKEIHKLDIGKLETTQVDLSKLSDVVKTEVAKKVEYNIKTSEIKKKILYHYGCVYYYTRS